MTRDRTSIVIVDRHPAVRSGLRAQLASEDVVVLADVSDGAQAIVAALSLRPHVLVMEFAPLVVDGVTVTRILARACPTVRVVLLATYEAMSAQERALAAGVAACILKGASRMELLVAVGRARNRDP